MSIEVAIIGIDGSGKSSTILQTASYLGEEHSVVVLGWKSIAYIEHGRTCYLSGQSVDNCPSYLERLSFLSTRTKATWYRLRKASLIKGLNSTFCIEDRDLLLDPSILATPYLPLLRKLSVSARVRFMKAITWGRLSDVYVYLDISPQAAFERVCARHRHEGKKLSAHENLPHLSQLVFEYESGLAFLEDSHIPVCRINSEERGVEECSRQIVDFLRQIHTGRLIRKR